jgi:multicomponent Na+:H+ antiporter subunit E
MLGWNLVLALVWCALAGRLGIAQLALGFGVGYVLIGWLLPGPEARAYLRRIPLLVAFSVYYAWEVIVATVHVAWEVVTPGARRSPGIIEVPLEVTTDAQIAMLVNTVTFTPGTVALDLTPDRRKLIVHDMFLKDPDVARYRIKHRYERWVLRLLG